MPRAATSPISGLIKPGDVPPRGGLYLLDVVPDGEVRFGFPNISDNAEIVELIACGCHLTLFTTGRGSVVGSAISPVIEDLRQSRHLPADGRRHGRGCRPDPRRPGHAGRSRAGKSSTWFWRWPPACATRLRAARAPGVHSDVQVLRAHRPRLPAAVSPAAERRPLECGDLSPLFKRRPQRQRLARIIHGPIETRSVSEGDARTWPRLRFGLRLRICATLASGDE